MLEDVIKKLEECQRDVMEVRANTNEYREITMVFKAKYWIDEAIEIVEEMKELRGIREGEKEDEN